MGAKKGLCLAACIVGGGLAVGEWLARTVLAQQTPAKAFALFEPDPHSDYRLASSMDVSPSGRRIRLNSLGIRDVEFAAEKPAGTFRIVGLGDSFAFGSGVSERDTFYEKCEAILRKQHRTDSIEILNTGCPGYGTWQEAALLEHRALAWQPDAIVLQVFLWNDTFESASQGAYIVQDGFLVPSAIAAEVSPLRRRLVEIFDHSALFRLLRARMANADAITEGGRVRTGGLDDRTRARLFVNGQRGVEPIATAWSTFIEQIRGLAAFARAHDLPLVVLCVPSLSEVHRPTAQTRLSQLAFPPDRVDWSGPANDLVAVAEKAGALVVDLGPAMRALDDDTIASLYLSDGHFSEPGHTLAAKQLARALARDPRFAPKARRTPRAK